LAHLAYAFAQFSEQPELLWRRKTKSRTTVETEFELKIGSFAAVPILVFKYSTIVH